MTRNASARAMVGGGLRRASQGFTGLHRACGRVALSVCRHVAEGGLGGSQMGGDCEPDDGWDGLEGWIMDGSWLDHGWMTEE